MQSTPCALPQNRRFARLRLRRDLAFAHAQLEKATPAVGGTVSSASEIRLEFSEGVEPKFSKVSLTGPSGAAVSRRGRGSRPAIRSPGRSRRQPCSRPAPTRSTGRRCPWTPITRRARSNSPSSERFAGLFGNQPARVSSHKSRSKEDNGHDAFFAISPWRLLSPRRPRRRSPRNSRLATSPIDKAWARATPKGADVGAGYLDHPQQWRDARPSDRRLGGFRHRRDP